MEQRRSELPLVTVGVPVYNGAPFLQSALESLRRQSLANFRVIIADNASIDDTRRIGEEFVRRDSRFEYVRHPQNVGARANFQYLVDAARTPFFLWLAADDSLEETHLERLVHKLQTKPEIVVAMSATQLTDAEGNHTRTIRYDGTLNPESLSRFGLGLRLAAGFPYHYFIYGLYRCDVIKPHWIRTPHVKGFDRLFVLKMALGFPFGYSSEPTYRRRLHAVPFVQRSAGSDESMERLYRTEFNYISSVRAFVPYMLEGRPRKVGYWLEVAACFVRYALFTADAMLRQIVKLLLGPTVLRRLRR